MASSRREPTLAQLIRRSLALDASARRQWLAVLPHLTPDDRERLREILLQAGVSPTPGPSPERTPHPPAITPTMGPLPLRIALIGCDVVRRTIFAGPRPDVPTASPASG